MGRRRSRAPSAGRLALALALVGAIGAVPLRRDGAAQTRASLFVDATSDVGVEMMHVNGAAGELLLPEVIGAGGALLDYDNDGDLDLFAVQSGSLRPGTGAPAKSRLFRNDLASGTTRLRFTDVTERSGVTVTGYGMGAAAGDFDNDGWVDLYVTALGSNRLFHNNRDGTFTDVTAASRADDPRWSVSASFFDYDRDGWLDLYVTNYVDFTPAMARACFSAASARDYCNPSVYAPVSDSLFHNERNGTFSNVSARAGITRSPARGLGVMAADVNRDGFPDVFVANDGDPNQLWMNEQGRGTFRDEALLSGIALNRSGQAQGSMGIDLGDVDNDGDEDLFVTNLDNEGNTFYRNVGKALFEDRSVEAGLSRLGSTGFGTRFIDYDLDGWLDLVVANGAVRHLVRQAQAGDPYPLKQRNLLYRNDGGRRFVDVTDAAGPAFEPLRVSRGVAAGDLDNDGDTDLVVFNNSGPLRILLDQAAEGRHWIGIRVTAPGGRDAVGTLVELRPPGRVLWRRAHADGSYASSSDPRVVFGVGSEREARTVRVHWADGPAEDFAGLAVDRYWRLERGRPPRPM